MPQSRAVSSTGQFLANFVMVLLCTMLILLLTLVLCTNILNSVSTFEDIRDAEDALYYEEHPRLHGRELDVQYAEGDRKTPHQMRARETTGSYFADDYSGAGWRGPRGGGRRRYSRSRSRSRSRSPQPRRRRSMSRSPSRSRSRSPRRSRSPVARRERSRSRSPQRNASRSPLNNKLSRSPMRKSGVRSRSRSPSPGGRNSVD